MTKFKKGDRVKVKPGSHSGEFDNLEGTVMSIDGDGRVNVDFNQVIPSRNKSATYPWGMRNDGLELVVDVDEDGPVSVERDFLKELRESYAEGDFDSEVLSQLDNLMNPEVTQKFTVELRGRSVKDNLTALLGDAHDKFTVVSFEAERAKKA